MEYGTLVLYRNALDAILQSLVQPCLYCLNIAVHFFEDLFHVYLIATVTLTMKHVHIQSCMSEPE